ncbi:serine/threonine-protein kinase [Streptomyces sp. NPDC049915]|uniref:serine/threonine-protein kinase n=1 Tax=Streptomyces sp. NPDC049915 TaxID=3155510 RepID=UPI0034158E3E
MTMGTADGSTQAWVAGRYRLLDIVHEETNRVCWYGEDTAAGQPRLLTRTGLPDTGTDADERDQARRATGRVLRMAETMSRLCPGRVPAVVDAVYERGDLWTVTEWAEGTPLGELLAQEGPLHPVRAARIALELLDVLEAAHAEGITHGELSPGQVLVRDHRPVAVTGFGLAGATLAPRVAAPSYASPEQARDERISPAADLWALGALLYTMVEGRPPFRERERPEATLKAVDRLPLRTPVRCGPLTRVVQGLLRKNSRERLSRGVVREALTRVLNEDPDAVVPSVPAPRLRRAYAAWHAGPAWRRRHVAVGAAVAVVAVTAVALALRQGPGNADAARAPAPSPAATGTPPAATGTAAAPRPSGTPTPGLPSGYRLYRAPEGFSVALPDDWGRLRTSPGRDGAYRVVFGATDDPRTLAVTYSERVGGDPVAVWRDDVEPALRAADGYRRIGAIRATTYQGRRAADMEWLVTAAGGTRVRTFGRGVLLGGGRGFSLRLTAPAADWDDTGRRQAQEVVLRSFRPASG